MSGTMETVSLPDQLPEQLQGTAAKADLFKVLETPPLLGRFFTADECVAGRDTVVLLTEEMWRKKFAAKPDVLGQTLRINGRIFTIIGVLPKAYSATFVFGEGQYFRPLVFSKEQQENRDRREAGLFLRLAPGVSLPQALASLAPVAERWVKENPRLYPNYHFRVQLAGRVGGSANVAIIALQLGLAAAILALACANLANLQMARAASRLRDLAIRSALGATRWMLIKQQLIESLVLSVTGGALGLLIADWSNDLIGRNIKLGLTSTLEMPIDGRVLGFTAADLDPRRPRLRPDPRLARLAHRHQRSPQATGPRLHRRQKPGLDSQPPRHRSGRAFPHPVVGRRDDDPRPQPHPQLPAQIGTANPS